MEKLVQTFLVTAEENEGCYKHGFSGTYKLRIGLAVAQLLRCNSDEEVTYWPLHLIRKFGFTSKTFFLYAGSRCKTGEGKFSFFTLEGQKITKCMSLQVTQIQSQHINKEDKTRIEAEMLTAKIQDKSKNHAVKTASDRSYTEPTAHRITESGYTEPANFLLSLSNKSKHATSVECCNLVESGATRPPAYEHEGDYYNSDLYSHLHEDESRIQENMYGMASASTPAPFSRKDIDNTDSPTYEYVN